jgi:hypothetical protein
MILHLYGTDGHDLKIPDYSIVGNLLFDVVAMTPARELSPWEKLFVVKNLGRTIHSGYLRDVYLASGCFEEAQKGSASKPNQRKLGDASWHNGDLQAAANYYSAEPDRLIKLAFFQSHWDRVIYHFSAAAIGRGISPGMICFGAWETSPKPYLEMLAIAVRRSKLPPPPLIAEILRQTFQMSPKKWAAFVKNPILAEEKTVAKLQRRCVPRRTTKQELTVEEALQKGNTARARLVAEYIRVADESLERAQIALEEFGTTGSENALDAFIGLVTGSGVTSVSHSFLFAAFGHDSFPTQDLPPDRLVRLFSRHPVMNKRHFGTLLDLRFKHRLPLTADDVLTGLFQSLGRWPIASRKTSADFDIAKLASCREWARVRLEDWLQGRGSTRIADLAQTWRQGRARSVQNPFYAGVVERPESPRNMDEWNDLMAEALAWLKLRWHREIGNMPWIAENQLYQILRRKLTGVDVLQHARPTWLEPQHLDVYIPEADIAVEYMGKQHFEPVEFFGGKGAFEELLKRDKRKADLCRAHSVDLIFVKYDEELGIRASEILDKAAAALARRRR